MLTKAERDTWLAELLDIRPLKDLEAVYNWMTTLRLRLRAALEAHDEADAEIERLKEEVRHLKTQLECYVDPISGRLIR